AEEVGLVGSYEYVKSLEKFQGKNIAAMINLDMIGVGNEVGIYTTGDRRSGVLLKMAENYVDKYELDIYPKENVSDRSDHASFAEAGIPAVFFSYEVDKNYHTKGDTLDKVSEQNLENIAKIVAEMTYDMAQAPRLQSTQGFNGIVNQYRHANPSKELE
ncbi:MAG: M28 family metallopeptidase, partial [Pseudomonadota bacterium]